MHIWQNDKWNTLLQKSWQVASIFIIDGISIQKRSLGLKQYWLFILGIDPKEKIDEKKCQNLCKKEKCLFLQLETLDYSENSYSLSQEKGSIFKTWYYKKFITPHTAVINLNLNEEEILSQMKPKWRYNIKIATKKWVYVEKVDPTDENINTYFQLSQETGQRDRFNTQTFTYFKDFLHIVWGAQLFLAFKDSQAIAWGIFVFQKEISYYYYWASTSDKEYRNLMAPYLLQWTAIQHAKNLWSELYDFLWISGPGVDFDPSLRWVTDFKLKLTPDTRQVSQGYIYINRKITYNFLNVLKKIKKFLHSYSSFFAK